MEQLEKKEQVIYVSELFGEIDKGHFTADEIQEINERRRKEIIEGLKLFDREEEKRKMTNLVDNLKEAVIDVLCSKEVEQEKFDEIYLFLGKSKSGKGEFLRDCLIDVVGEIKNNFFEQGRMFERNLVNTGVEI